MPGVDHTLRFVAAALALSFYALCMWLWGGME